MYCKKECATLCAAGIFATLIIFIILPYYHHSYNVRHIIIIGCDGMGQVYIENATSLLPNIEYMMYYGSIYNKTRNKYPTSSAPNWASILTGMSPDDSGIINNDWIPNNDNPKNITQNTMPPISGNNSIPQPIWSVIKEQYPEYTTSVIHSWFWIKYLVNNDVDFHYNSNGNDTDTERVVLEMINKHNLNKVVA